MERKGHNLWISLWARPRLDRTDSRLVVPQGVESIARVVAASEIVRRLHPVGADSADCAPALAPSDLRQEYHDTRRRRLEGRPWVMVNMVTSVDGASVLGGVSGGLGGAGDRAIFAVIRALADVILVGAGTVRAEGYGPPKKPGQRIAVVTRSGDLDWSSTLFTSGAGIVVLPEDGPTVPGTNLRAGRGHVDLATALARFDGDVVLAEGGPTLNGQLLAEGLVDELCVTISPRLVGGSAKRIFVGPTAPTGLSLVGLLEDEGFLFCRYVRSSLLGGAPTA